MTAVNINPEEFIPRAESQVFHSHPSAKFWVGRLAVGSIIEQPIEYRSVHQLRADVYVHEMGWLSVDDLDEHGGETDSDDNRSIEFGVFENLNNGEATRAIGAIRLIEKRHENDLLPVENFFPEVFRDNPAEIGSVEVSRWIARHPDQALQGLISLAAIRAADLYCVNNNVPNTYSVLEKPHYMLLKLVGVPAEKLCQPKEIKEYGNTSNMAVRINPQKLLENALNPNGNGRQEIMREFFNSALNDLGLGHYDQSLQG